ncbi:phosphotransferase family protein [Paucibacter sp. Y2R2-4]|uniref:phosphotransferase family protein n=1 Tax=Paucibacter sp. Y2R2-4 TaxID=2893553 RepID=UPI0021E3904C|nr:phosphotransferase family protein [Paucibacter sp. Y2R2-4]MCV2348603.1 phosphotransferase family protein [Paucibacter sp. Y2R2-4]
MSPMDAFTGTISPNHAIDGEALSVWLSAHLNHFDGPLRIEQFKGGQSNPTYKLITPSRSYVMRAKPGPAAKLLPSAHAIEREFAVMSALAGSTVPVPKMLALCEDESIIGRAFYVMEFMDGRVLWDPALPGMPPSERHAVFDEMNRVMAALHRIEPAAIGLASYGKPGNYFERQIARWSKQYRASITRPIEAMERLIDWLPNHMPDSALDEREVAIVHGDFRIDNLMFHPREPRVIAALDWELSTLGHPLADFSYHCMSWHIKTTSAARGLAGLDLQILGIPSELDYVRRYCERSGRSHVETLMRDWNFYLAYNLFRIAAILQGIAKRVEEGTASSAQAREAAAGAAPLAALGWQFAERSSSGA